MLALLRVAPRLPSPTLRAAAISPQVGTGKQALIDQTGKLRSGVQPPAVMHFYSGPPMHLLSGVDTNGGLSRSPNIRGLAPMTRPTSTLWNVGPVQ